MRTHARHSRGERSSAVLQEEHERREPFELLTADDADEADEAFDEEGYDAFRVHCPDCARPIAILPGEDVLPQHALCASPWNPFGLTICPGSGRPAAEATPAGGDTPGEDTEWGTLLTLPAGLDWRTQPFSHVGGPGSRPLRVPLQRAA
ncbi:hypothetical protein [Actinacidiphila sp. bgisy167]|uniref:hypothetical protein n=1 Tax=Actinacidiphila sp. bgisy167 TaxID=3413797 RepID=UPI003D754BD8